MELALIDEVMGCLPKELTLFWYFKDRYAPYLLEKELEDKGPRTIGELKRSRFSRLVQKPVSKAVVSRVGGRPVSASDFAALWPESSQPSHNKPVDRRSTCGWMSWKWGPCVDTTNLC